MRRNLLIAATIALCCVTAAAFLIAKHTGSASAAPALASTPTRSPTPKPSPTPAPPPPPIVIGPSTTPGVFAAQCMSGAPNSVRVTFLWGPSRSGPQWLDLSIFNDGFAPGTFVGAGGFTPPTWGFIWDGLVQGTTHFARVNTLTSQGWKPSGTVSFFTPICAPYIDSPWPTADMMGLHDQLWNAIANSGINAAVAITDLQTHETVDVGGYDNRLPGCTINLFVLLRVAEDLQFGRYPEEWVGATIAQTINQSNPILARALMRDYVGAGDLGRGMTQVNDFVHSLGMTSTLMDHPPAFPEESIYGGIDNRITARDVNRGLQALWDGRVLNPWWRDYMLQQMTKVKPGLNYLIPVGTSNGAIVSHKNGFLYSEGWADNDIGIVWFDRGGARVGYAISFFSQGVSTKYADIPLGQTVSSLAYQWFVGRYGYP